MVDIDFNRVIDSISDKIELGKMMFMTEQQQNDYFSKKISESERNFYENGGRHNSARQLYMLKMITSPMIENNGMGNIQHYAELGNGYQPDPNTPLVFIPQYNDHVDVYYKSHRLFDIEFKDRNGNQNLRSGLKSFMIPDQNAKKSLALIPNEEWNQVVENVVGQLLLDKNSNEFDVMTDKTDTEYIRKLHLVIDARKSMNDVTKSEYLGSPEKPSTQEIVNSVSDQDLQKMYESMMSGKMMASDSIDHQYGG